VCFGFVEVTAGRAVRQPSAVGAEWILDGFLESDFEPGEFTNLL
jgi:hypothetical protein